MKSSAVDWPAVDGRGGNYMEGPSACFGAWSPERTSACYNGLPYSFSLNDASVSPSMCGILLVPNGALTRPLV